ncbi:hypothetical protein [Hydrogenimonas sp.]
MSRRVTALFAVTLLLTASLAAELLYFGLRAPSEKADRAYRFVSFVGLPDLAVATEAGFIRFRSLSDPFAPFNEDPTLPDHFPAAFTYAPAPMNASFPSRILLPGKSGERAE